MALRCIEFVFEYVTGSMIMFVTSFKFSFKKWNANILLDYVNLLYELFNKYFRLMECVPSNP